MSIDGVFVHHLINELNDKLKQNRVKRFIAINYHKFVLNFAHSSLLIELNSSEARVCITNDSFVASPSLTLFQSILKKQLEKSVLVDFLQHENDRIIYINFLHFDDLGYQHKRCLVVELFGRNTNALLLDEENKIIDCYKRKAPSDDNDIIALPNVLYKGYPSEKQNPFLYNKFCSENIYQGVSKLLFTEMCYRFDLNLINGEVKPTLFNLGHKSLFYCFDLSHIDGNRQYFNSLSELLEYYFNSDQKQSYNQEQVNIINYVNHEIQKATNKLSKQKNELILAQDNLKYEKLGNILAANLYTVKQGMEKVVLFDFYDNQDIEIKLDPYSSPIDNLNGFYNKYKKAKRTIEHLSSQIETTANEIKYYECLLDQINLSKILDLKEIIGEVKPNKQQPKGKPNLTIYYANGDTIYVGKNNTQNNYLTNKLANKNDYFFHVQGSSGSHTILRTDSLTSDNIKLAAMIAAYYSKARYSNGVAVDYTLIKNVKKVNGVPGSFVTYTHQKTTFVTPDIDWINQNASLHK